MLHLKKHLAYWNEFCPGGKFPSGKNETDALKYVILKVNESNNDDAVDDEEEAKVDKRAVGDSLPLLRGYFQLLVTAR